MYLPEELEKRVRTLEIRLEEVEKVVHSYEEWRRLGRAIQPPKVKPEGKK